MERLTNYFAAEPAILARLQALVPASVRSIQPALSSDQCIDFAGTGPAAFLIYGGSVIEESSGSKRSAIRESQTWIVAIVVQNVRDTIANSQVRQTAGPILSAIDGLLLGFTPINGSDENVGVASSLRGVTAPEAFRDLPGLGIFLRAYEMSFVNSAETTRKSAFSR